MANKKDPPNNKLAALMTTAVMAADKWNRDRMAKKDVRTYQAAGIIKDPTSDLMDDETALKQVSKLRETKEGRQQIRGLRATGQRDINIKDYRADKKAGRKTARAERKTERKTARMKKKYGEMKVGGAWTRNSRKHGG